MKKSDDVVGLQKKDVLDANSKTKNKENAEDVVDLGNHKNNGDAAGADTGNGNSSNNTEENDNDNHPVLDDGDSDIIVLGEDQKTPSKTKSKDEKCSSKSSHNIGIGNSSINIEETINHPVIVDDSSDIIVLREDKITQSKPKSKDENCSSEARLRSSIRLRGKRPKLVEITTSDEDENQESDDDFIEERVSKSKSFKKRFQTLRKRASLKTATKSGRMSEGKTPPKRSPNESKSKKLTDPASKISKEFTSGAFVVLKTDFHASTTPAIWRIDGKALLQKYINFDQDGQTLYKNTSTYSGWVANNKDQYYPATVEIKSQSRKETVVKFLREAIIVDDSD